MTEDKTWTEPGVITKVSPRSVADTVSRLTHLATGKGLKVFGVIDQRAAGTPVMVAAPLSALDLPLKVLIWSDNGQTNVTYYAPDALAARHRLSPDLAARLAGIDPLTDAVVAR